MVNIEYAKLFNSISRLFKPSSRLESLEKKYFYSMAQLGSLKDLKKGVSLPYYRESKEEGQVEIPDDFFNLNSVPNIVVDVWYLGDVSSLGTNKDYAFRLTITGYAEVHPIEILYGVVSGIQEVIVFGRSAFHCKVPKGFTIADFAFVLNQGKIKDFVFNYCASLTKHQKELIDKMGIK